MSKQSKTSSLLEASLNTGSGFLLSFLTWWLVVAPLFGIPFQFGESFEITVIFTVVTLIRSYLWRRFFNSKQKG